MPTQNNNHQDCRQVYFLINEFILWHLSRVRARFDGDLDCALILGEIAHFNVQKIISRNRIPDAAVDEALQHAKQLVRFSEAPEIDDLLKPCNSLSISAATGIPRETVRRKIQWLEAQGWIEKNAKGHLLVTPLPAQVFGEFNQEMMNEFLVIAERVRSILQVNTATAEAIHNNKKPQPGA